MMSGASNELCSDWLNFARASLGTRIQDTEEIAGRVLKAVQAIANQLDQELEIDALVAMQSDSATSAEILALLQSILQHLDSQDELSRLISPMYAALQFEDRTRQKLQGLLGILSVWADVRNDDSIDDAVLVSRLMHYVVTTEQKAILAEYFEGHIDVNAMENAIEFF